MDDSEFVVVDDEHRGFMAINNLKETVQAYVAARDSLLKGAALLHDTLNLTMELALKNTSPDFQSDIDELRKSVLGSLDASSETVLRDHVKSLCSKLVAVKSEYDELAKKFEALSVGKSAERPPQVTRLAAIFDDIDACLPNTGVLTSDPAAPQPTDLDELCNRAESIRDRLKIAIKKPTLVAVTTSNPVSSNSEDLEQNSEESSTKKLDSEMNCSFCPHFSDLNLVRRTSSEVSLHHQQRPLQYTQHAPVVPPSLHYHQHLELDRRQFLSAGTRHSLLLDEDIRLPVGHVERLKKKLSASLNFAGASLDNVPSNLCALPPRRIPGGSEPSRPPTPPPRSTSRRLIPQATVKATTSKMEDLISLQKNVASLAAAAALRRNISIQAKELIVDGCGEIRERVVPPRLPPRRSVSVHTQTEPPGGILSWWTFLESPPWQRQNSMSFSAASSGIGIDDGASNFQDDISSVSKTCFVCCKHNTFVAAGRPHCGISNCSSTCLSSDLLQEVSRMIREEVATVLKSEMEGLMERQMSLIQQALKPLSDEKPTAPPAEQVQDPPEDYRVVHEGNPIASNIEIEVFEEAEVPSGLQNSGEADRPVYQPMLLPVPHRLLPSCQRRRKSKPSFLPDEERPLCPKCQRWLPDREALEVHLDSCLQ
ncbi:hypothetical protein Aperf_G00000098002 [Anoplocephala perfoliata]